LKLKCHSNESIFTVLTQLLILYNHAVDDEVLTNVVWVAQPRINGRGLRVWPSLP